MMRMFRPVSRVIAGCALTALVTLTAATGAAQSAPSADTKSVVKSDEVRGIALSSDGKARLHLGADASAGFDTNPYSTALSGSEFSGDALLRVNPNIKLNYPGSLVDFSMSGSADMAYLLGAVRTVSFPNNVVFNVGGDASLQVNRNGMFGFALENSLSWAQDPGFLGVSVFNRINEKLGAGFVFRPGGGALTAKLGYQFGLELWEPVSILQGTSSAQNTNFGNTQHSAVLRVDWRFLPRTGFFFDARGGARLYNTGSATPNNFPLNARLGVLGQLSRSISAVASVGYANPFATDATGAVTTLDYIGVTAQGELRWAISQRAELAAGLTRDMSPVPLYQFLTSNRAYLRYKQPIGRQFEMNLSAFYTFIQYGTEQDDVTDRTNDRVDGQIDAEISLRYQPTKWLGFGLSNTFAYHHSNATLLATNTKLDFVRNQTLLTVSLMY